MTEPMRDDEFEALLARALKAEEAPADLAQRLEHRRPGRGQWLIALMNPGRVAAGAAILSLLAGFALGLGNATVGGEDEVDVVASLYAANDVGEF
jgi:hypothetical protein